MFNRRWGVAAGVSAAALVVAGQGPAAGAWRIEDGAPAQLVVRSPGSLTAADDLVRQELVGLGYAVSVVDDDAAVSASAETAVVVLAASADTAALGTRYKTVGSPLVALGNNGWAETGLTQGPAGLSYDTTSLVVLDTAHPVADGLPGQFAPAETTTVLQSVNEAFLPTGADPVAARAGEQNRHVVFTVPAGAALGDGSAAPAARVVLGYSAETVTNLSEAGYQLLHNAIYWADDAVAVAEPAQLAPPPLIREGQWNLDAIRTATGGSKFTPSAVDPADNGVLDSETTVARTSQVALAGTAALDFPGWNDDNNPQQPGVQVHPTKSSVRIPGRIDFNPLARQKFVVTAYIRPDDSTAAGSPVAPDDSPNIVQKGLQPDANGAWKMSLSGDLRPSCSFFGRDDTDPQTTTLRRIVSADVGQQENLTPGLRYRIDCILEPQKATIKVFRVDPNVGEVPFINEFQTYPLQTVFIIDNDDPVWIGKKPEVTVVADTYAGAVDNVAIKRTSS